MVRYDATSRRRVRALARLTAAAARPSLYPIASTTNAYWWDGNPNFGDALTPWLLPHYSIIPLHSSPADAAVIGVGSIIEHVPRDFVGHIWGSGLLRDEERTFPDARVIGVRGRLTCERLGVVSENVTLGDPGLLVSRVMRRPKLRWRLGVVPHHAHLRSIAMRRLLAEDRLVRWIDVRRRPGVVVREIASCEAIVTTSLHGLVVADSFGIPAFWTTLDPPLFGGTFKFLDYESVVSPDNSRHGRLTDAMSLADVLGQVGLPSKQHVDVAVSRLERSVAEIPTIPVVPPLAIPRWLVGKRDVGGGGDS